MQKTWAGPEIALMVVFNEWQKLSPCTSAELYGVLNLLHKGSLTLNC